MKRAEAPKRRRRARGLTFAGRAARKVVIATVGGAVLAVGVALLVLPGPGMLVLLLGLGILSTEYHWPKRLKERLKERAKDLAARAKSRRRGR